MPCRKEGEGVTDHEARARETMEDRETELELSLGCFDLIISVSELSFALRRHRRRLPSGGAERVVPSVCLHPRVPCAVRIGVFMPSQKAVLGPKKGPRCQSVPRGRALALAEGNLST